MARRNSITILADSVEVSKGSTKTIDLMGSTQMEGLVVKIKNPTEDDLIRLISECSSLLEWRRNRSEGLE
jgi:hypothetical protein|tara:strand:- start:6039 stop:6248 length:210 start_codon:yes stop_codon:yes gene_type:complete